MRDFLKSRAGRQFVVACCCAVILWCTAFSFKEEIFRFLAALGAEKAALVLITANVAGLVSFVYSILRILGLRDEMVRRRQAEQRADYIATHDFLTRLPNRYAFDRHQISRDRMNDEEEDREASATVYSIDLDGFKKINDLMGHQCGDLLLKEVSRRICALAEPKCVFRFGGDEFIAIGPNLSKEKEERFAQLLIQSITRPVHLGSMTAEVGASVGYARLPEHGLTLGEVSHASDIALYEAKSRGPNNHVLFQPEMQAKASRRAKLEGELRRAIDQELIVPFYQPLVDLRTGDICGFEALARWQDEDGVSIQPGVFIPVAEETGLITRLFQKLLTRACEDAKGWQDDIILSFNVSPVQMEDRMLHARILEILSKTGFPAQRLEIEITENALIQVPEYAASIMENLHALGIQMALDDFGTGYSSLSQLARYKFDKIKIDKSFVAACIHDKRQEKIIQAMLNLSRGLHVKTTVEGIEDYRQVAYFLGLGCDIGQGYVFGEPMPAEDVSEFLLQRSRILTIANPDATNTVAQG